MLHAVNTQHGLQRIGPSAIARLGIKRLDDFHHVLPWQNLLHAGEENLFSGLTALSAEFTIGEGELMAHDVPLGCAPDEYDDLISGTCSHLPYGLTDVVSERFDAGVRLGGEMDKDMIAIRIGPDIPMAIVGSPDYFSRRSVPTSVSQLIDHQAINLYLPTSGTANRWRLIRGGREVRVRMEGQLLLNTIDLIIDAAIDGHGLAYLPYDQVERAIKEKKLIRVLDKFTPDLPGYHLYYPHRRHAGSAFSLFIDRLKYKGAV
ncbi:putative transcriptional regulator LYSR-type [Escherichia coli R424]|nr:putative transcriptional regulator LYSR-type [Escherichia coli R424]